ncbi:hypothetical protein V6Z11_D06G206000 [Gossypium hirsutum]
MVLAQANSQMLAELNSSKDRLKALKHELGCKNALLKAIKLELGTNKCGKVGESHDEEDGENKPCNMNGCGETGESLKGEDEENKPCNMTRKRQSYDLGPCNIKPVQGKEGVKNKSRMYAKRQSARHKTQAETTEYVIEVDDTKSFDSTCDDKVHESGPSDIKPVQAKEGIDNKRVCLKRQSARFKAQEPETTEYMCEVDTKSFAPICDDKVCKSGPSDSKSAQGNERGDSKRVLRRQSAKIRAQEPEMSVDVSDVDDVRCLFSSTSDDKVHESGQLSSDSSVKSEQEEGNTSMSTRSEAQELRRVSVGRPLRRAVEKVQSYKEMKLNVKMRREV